MQSVVIAATLRLLASLIERSHCARPRLYWYNGHYYSTSLTRTHLLLTGNDTVPISIQYGTAEVCALPSGL